MKETTKTILSGLLTADDEGHLTLPLAPEIYSSAAVREAADRVGLGSAAGAFDELMPRVRLPADKLLTFLDSLLQAALRSAREP